jgi:hypothetical protein
MIPDPPIEEARDFGRSVAYLAREEGIHLAGQRQGLASIRPVISVAGMLIISFEFIRPRETGKDNV